MSDENVNNGTQNEKNYRVSDGIETLEFEQPDDTKYKQYFDWITRIKGMCTEDKRVAPPKEPVYEDYLEEGYEEYAEDSYEMAKEIYEWQKQHFILDNGLHVYIKGENVQILYEEFPNQDLGCECGMTLLDGDIEFLLGEQGPYFPYNITYMKAGEGIRAELPVRGILYSHTSIDEILSGGLNYVKEKVEAPRRETLIDIYEKAIAVHNVISDMVKETQKASKGTVTARDLAAVGLEMTPEQIAEGEKVVEGKGKDIETVQKDENEI